MSPRTDWDKPKSEETKVEPKIENKVQQPFIPEQTRPFTIMTENDAYIAERMKGQPQSISDIEVTTNEEKMGVHRLSLPDYFEEFSNDCTTSIACSKHGWKVEKVAYGYDKTMDRYVQTKHGKYIFKWLSKNKRALDRSINVAGWYLVNRSFFPEAPSILFGVNGGVEEGDAILGFMSVQKALAIRNKPAKESHDRVHSVNTAHEGNPNFYKAKLGTDDSGEGDNEPSQVIGTINYDGTTRR